VELEPAYLWGQAALAEVEIVAGETAAARARLQGILDYEGRWQSEQNPAAMTRAHVDLAYLAERASLGSRGACYDSSETYRRAEVARLRARPDLALERLREFFVSGGVCAEAHRSLGRVLLAGDQFDGAEDAFRRALAADPALPGARFGLAQIAAVRGDGAAATEYLREELSAAGSSRDPLVYLELGLVAERLLGDADAAARHFAAYRERGGDPQLLEARRGSWQSSSRK
jgi:tetratricopeptide (TPR) repeat protein